MKRLTGLSRQIVLSMSTVVTGAVTLVILGSYAFYGLFLTFWPTQFPAFGSWMPSAPEWAWMVLTIIAALVLAVTVASKLARRILLPLNSVADNLRLVAQGDLSARAVTVDHSLGEAAQLVDDFNAMAERMQRLEQEQIFWNAAIAHELRTPLTILRGRLQGFVDGVFTPDVTQFRSLLTQVEGLAHLIEDLRTISLAEAGHLALDTLEISLAAEIESVVQLFEPHLQLVGLKLILELDACPVHCDPARIRQVLMALLENARRHAVAGRLVIRTSTAKGWYFLTVQDDGPGIPSAIASSVFEAFQRGDNSLSRSGGGSGLGLAVVRAIAQAHGGQATYHLSSQGGTVFEISWPLGPAVAIA